MNEFLWVEKYRPKNIEHCILPDDLKKTFKSFVDAGEVPNLLLCGTAGIGKTTVAKALCHELGVDSIVINGSDEGRFLDTVRNTAKQFASTVSLTSSAKHKVIIIDEADNTTHDVQLLLRASIEEFQNNCRFIFTCNFRNKLYNLFIQEQLLLIAILVENRNNKLLHNFLKDVVVFLQQRIYNLLML